MHETYSYASLGAPWSLALSRCPCCRTLRAVCPPLKCFQNVSSCTGLIASVNVTRLNAGLFRWINGAIHINFWLIVLICCADTTPFLLPWPQSSASFVTTVMTLSSIFSSLALLLFLLPLQCFCEKPISRFKFPFKKKKKKNTHSQWEKWKALFSWNCAGLPL